MTETITSVSRVGGAHQHTSLSCLVLNGLPSPGHMPFHVTLLFAKSHSFLHFPSLALALLITLPGTRSAHCTSPCWLTQGDPNMSLWSQLRSPRTHCDLHLRFHIPTLAAGYTCLLSDLSPTRQPDSGSWGHIHWWSLRWMCNHSYNLGSPFALWFVFSPFNSTIPYADLLIKLPSVASCRPLSAILLETSSSTKPNMQSGGEGKKHGHVLEHLRALMDTEMGVRLSVLP